MTRDLYPPGTPVAPCRDRAAALFVPGVLAYRVWHRGTRLSEGQYGWVHREPIRAGVAHAQVRLYRRPLPNGLAADASLTVAQIAAFQRETFVCAIDACRLERFDPSRPADAVLMEAWLTG